MNKILQVKEGLEPSYFVSYSDKNPRPMAWQDIYQRIATDVDVAANTARRRERELAGDRAGADRWKRASGAFTPAVQCKGGHAAAHVVGHTGVALVDLDHIPSHLVAEAKAKVVASSFTFLCYITSSGQGLRILYRYKTDGPATYREVFDMGNDFYSRLTGVAYDPQASDDTRLSYFSYDAEAYFNPHADAMPFHVKDAFDRVVDDLLAAGEIYDRGHHNNFVAMVGYQCNRRGIAEAEAVERAVRRFTEYDDTEAVIRSCYRHKDEFGTRPVASGKRGPGRPRSYASTLEMEAYLNTQGIFRRNVMTGDVCFRPSDTCCIPADELTADGNGYSIVTDTVANTFFHDMAKTSLPPRSVSDLWTLLQSAFAGHYHPVAEYLKGLAPWDGKTDYIDNLAATIHTTAGDELFGDCFRKWLVGFAASILSDNVNENILVLTGAPGIGKTTFFQRLLPPHLQPYFCIKHDNSFANKDDITRLSSNAIVCLEEVDVLKRKDNAQIKSVTTDRRLHVRRPYARVDSLLAHNASLCGTSNDPVILTDPTGNRRWLIFEVTSMKLPYSYDIPYDCLYAQARDLFRQGFPFYSTQQEIARLDSYRRAFEVPSVEEELLTTWVRRPRPGEQPLFLNATALIGLLTERASLKQNISVVHLGRALRKLGYERQQREAKKGYMLVVKSREEVEREQRAVSSDDPLAGALPF